ncbi:MAG: MFS transporter [Rhodospirillaceae bacterium]
MTTSDQPSPSGTPARPLASGLAATWAAQTMGTIAVFGVPVLAPVIAPEMGIHATLVGLYVSMVYLTGQVTGLLTGGFIERYGALRLSQVSCIMAAAGIFLLFPASPWLAVFAALAMGTCYGPLNPTSSAILRGLGSDRYQPLIFSIKQTGVPVAGVIVGTALPALTVAFGWRWAFGIFAVVSLAVAVALQPLRETFDHARRRDGGRPEFRIVEPLKLILKHPPLRATAFIGFALAGSQICVASFFVLYLIQAQGYSLVDAGLIYAAVQGGGVVGRVMWGAVAKQVFTPVGVLIGVSIVICGLFVAVALMTSDWPYWAVIGVSLALGACSFGWNGVWLSEIADLAPDNRVGDVTGGGQFLMFGGVTALPPLFAVLVNWQDGYRMPFIAAGVFVLLVAGYLALVRWGARGQG